MSEMSESTMCDTNNSNLSPDIDVATTSDDIRALLNLFSTYTYYAKSEPEEVSLTKISCLHPWPNPTLIFKGKAHSEEVREIARRRLQPNNCRK